VRHRRNRQDTHIRPGERTFAGWVLAPRSPAELALLATLAAAASRGEDRVVLIVLL